MVTCTADVTKLTSVGSGGVMVQFTEPTAIDDSGSVAILWASHRPGQYFNTGSTPVTYTFIDPSGNKGSCEFQVIVIEGTFLTHVIYKTFFVMLMPLLLYCYTFCSKDEK